MCLYAVQVIYGCENFLHPHFISATVWVFVVTGGEAKSEVAPLGIIHRQIRVSSVTGMRC